MQVIHTLSLHYFYTSAPILLCRLCISRLRRYLGRYMPVVVSAVIGISAFSVLEPEQVLWCQRLLGCFIECRIISHDRQRPFSQRYRFEQRDVWGISLKPLYHLGLCSVKVSSQSTGYRKDILKRKKKVNRPVL